jgi:TRAP-type transport system small permease protein
VTLIVDWFFRGLKFFIVACLALMVVLVFGNVVLRYAFNSGITVSEELSRWLFVWLTFVGAVLALRDHKHLGVDSLVSRLSPLGKKVCFIASNILMLFCVWLFFKGSWDQTIINIGNMAPATGLSQGWFYYSVGVFFSVFAAALLVRNLYHAATGQLSEEDLVQIRESEDVDVDEIARKHAEVTGGASAASRGTKA